MTDFKLKSDRGWYLILFSRRISTLKFVNTIQDNALLKLSLFWVPQRQKNLKNINLSFITKEKETIYIFNNLCSDIDKILFITTGWKYKYLFIEPKNIKFTLYCSEYCFVFWKYNIFFVYNIALTVYFIFYERRKWENTQNIVYRR